MGSEDDSGVMLLTPFTYPQSDVKAEHSVYTDPYDPPQEPKLNHHKEPSEDTSYQEGVDVRNA